MINIVLSAHYKQASVTFYLQQIAFYVKSDAFLFKKIHLLSQEH
jgi:hypothetical protein